MTLYCSKCGKQIPENAKFCPYCGEEVIFNRNNPDAVEIKAEDIKEAEFEEAPKQEVVREPVREDNSQQIAQLEDEIKTYEKRRKGLVIPGAILLGIFLVATIVFAILFVKDYYEFIKTAMDPNAFDEWPDTLVIWTMMLSVCDIGFTAGLALLLVGIIPNTIKYIGEGA